MLAWKYECQGVWMYPLKDGYVTVQSYGILIEFMNVSGNEIR